MNAPAQIDPTSGADLAHHLSRFPGRRVLVLGDVMLDRYVEGEVRRISPEAPIQILRARARRAVPGGAGNVAFNIAALGASALLVSVVGADDAGGDLERALAAAGDIKVRLIRDPARPTTVKTRFTSGGHHLLRLDEEETGPIGAATETAVLAAFAEALAEADVVVLSDYTKGLLTDTVLTQAIALARAAGRPLIADPKRADFTAYRGATVLTPNAAEASRATGVRIVDDATAAEAGARALEHAAAEAMLITRSEKGLTLVRRGQAPLHVPTQAREVADVSGAGDTLTAAFALMLATGADLPAAAAIGNIAAGIVVGKHGTGAVSQAELADALRQRALLDLDSKIAGLAVARERVEGWRRAGQIIGFTNGCFDLIHPGHVRLLARARARCDRLVVALNTDASVRRLKGPDRPVQTEMARATVMASIAAADLVVLFEEDTPEALIAALGPDRLFKGADYRLDQVVGADLVRARGGEVVLIELEAGHSTTNTIRRINRTA
jgi:D-beta-D-heptose 7-phosphate kinase/D-beta-D-heptose 1-phosphate adenosyltransferase